MFKQRPGAMPACTWVRAWTAAAVGSLCATSIVWANGTHTGHQFSVTETGEATISIPIQVPRGIAGMEPQLSLNYSSGAGNGLLGVGWYLAGPSSIARCGKTPRHDAGVRGTVTFSTADRFCLDGQRLLSDVATTDTTYGAANTVYWAERESFSRITAVGSFATGVPAGFKVETKSGLVLEFGAIPNVSSSVDAQGMNNPVDGTSPTINRWLLKRISDRMAPNAAQPTAQPNYVEFYYCKFELAADLTCPLTGTHTGSQVLHYVRYTNRGATPNGTAAVMFGYESRPDRILKFHYGASQMQTQRLAYISTYLGFTSPTTPGDRIKSYEFTYEPMQDGAGVWTRATNVSRLTRIQELHGGVASLTTRPPPARTAADALPPLDFTYAPDSVYGQAVSQTAASGSTAPRPNLNCGGYVGAYRATYMCP
jgi:hypothetical protein